MNFRVTMALALVLVALAGAYFLVGYSLPEETATGTPQAAQPSLIGYAQGDISGIAVQAGTGRIALQKTDGVWGYGLGNDAPSQAVDATRVNGLLARLAGLKAQLLIAAKPSADQVAEYGLQQPAAQVTVNKGSEGIVLNLGQQNVRRTGYYARRGAEAPVYLVESFLVDDLKRLLTEPPVPPTPTPVPSATAGTASETPRPGP